MSSVPNRRGIRQPADMNCPYFVCGDKTPVSLGDVGWVWEGVAFDPGVQPTIYGVGEGARYFGLKRACFMFHRTNEVALQKLRSLDQVVCDITKWEFREMRSEEGRVGFTHSLSGDPSVTLSEAENLSRLSRDFPNVAGAIIDDFGGLIKNRGYSPQRLAQIHSALKRDNDNLNLWTVVYAHELDPQFWAPYLPHLDVANLWVWKAEDLPHLDEYLDGCAGIFLGKPIILGCYLRDYPTLSPVPLELLRFEFERIAAYLEQGRIAGFSILAACLIDQHPEQAAWVRDFLAGR